ncbi:hypothetical protein A2757_02470 [Candidatus Giovannonibacteria bacterium RIFCSPHIGHO2_01_FULL_48_47]|nr:MAG: hypothetical protein A2757_02470 [Candidatus Giovannonibacteria bacterium RIFCSPHIGHO2_01_FULL_48_47]OGF68603.1 MAG: hypothetical protein A3D61_01685 [Candidatus Giovannonibacteria bacterium RIFCSPHIGHO2_02_FULL_48_15]OGF88510.1 MAG: hypothetical protein A3B26_02180 [Candidatus Giovannonibacteria bacterium RIFCSPLOWO2_01_FULL_48_47]OGF95447.1 MAG: hypothetical protein A2433_00285 [Candidatus Giovannonibacteria bacterium RIFOXYC1_FULL_48_8]OGF96461.1 MAG: hypothetical protein A2613_02805
MQQGLIVKPDIEEEDLNRLVQVVYKNGCTYISVVTPHNESTRLTARVERAEGFNRVEIDMRSCNWNISEAGQGVFIKLAEDWPEDIKNAYCGKSIMRVYIKHDDEKMWGVGLWLMYMLKVLAKGENLEEVKLS